MILRLVFIFFSFVFTVPLVAGNYRFLHLNSRNGLSHQQVEAIAEDGSGYIWIGTRNGLCKYDGYKITTYYHNPHDLHSLKHNYIHYLFSDREGHIWIGTEAGLCRYRPKYDNFVYYPGSRKYAGAMAQLHCGKLFAGGDGLYLYNPYRDSFKRIPTLDNGYIFSMSVDSHDNLFVSTNNSIYWYDHTFMKIHPLNISYYSHFIKNFNVVIQPIKIDFKDRLWIGRNGQGVMWINLKTKKSHIYPSSLIANGIVRTIEEDNDHNMWIGTEGGISVIHPNGIIEKLRHVPDNPYSISDNAIYKILCDHHRNIWIGSWFGGVDLLAHSNTAFRWIQPGIGPDNLKASVVRMLVEVKPGIFWIALENGGINIYDSHTGMIKSLTSVHGLGTNVHSLCYDRKNKVIWIGTRFDGLISYNLASGIQHKYYLKKGLDAEGIFYIAQQRNGNLWVATMKGLRLYDASHDVFVAPQNKILRNEYIYTLYVDHQDNLWVGTTNHGIFWMNHRTRQFHHILAGHKGLKDNYILCMYQDLSGRMWFGTNNNGLQYLDKKKKYFCSLSDDLLSKTTICSINADRFGCLWISTSQGLFRYDGKNKRLNRYSQFNGLPISQFNFSSSLRAMNGDMLFGTINGLIIFNPGKINISYIKCDVHFKNLTIGNVIMNASMKDSPLKMELDSTKTLHLSYSQAHSFSIEYGVIMPCMADGVEYQIKVEGIDKNWHNVGTDCKFSSYNIRPGTYVFHVRARFPGQNWQSCPVRTLKIIISPPFYATIWAYFFYLMAACFLVWYWRHQFLIRQKERNAVKIAHLEKEKVEEVDKAKFNFFTVISHELKTPLSLIMAPLKGISVSKLDEKEKKYLNIALRNVHKMQILIDELVTFNKLETNNFPFYVQKGNPLVSIMKYSNSFGLYAKEKNINFDIDCEDNGEEVWFSPSYLEHIIGNLLTNAFKFTPQGGDVFLRASIVEDSDNHYNYLFLKVSDTGIGIEKSELNSIFSKYYQTQSGYITNSRGWGIGLALVKRMVNLHKGQISVSSQIGSGTTFLIWLNVSAGAFDEQCRITNDKVIVPMNQYQFPTFSDSPSKTDQETEDIASIKDKDTLLIVDDNRDFLSFLVEYFSRQYKVLPAINSEEALNLARQESISLVISDVMMPGMDGNELCRCLKKNMQTSHIPVILLTAKTDSQDVVTGYKSGADSYISKPFDPQVLELQIKNILQLVKSRQEEIVNTKEKDIDTIAISDLDKEFIHKMNAIVNKHIKDSDFSVSDITIELGMSRSLLHTKMKSLMNISMGDYIRNKRIELACDLLKKGFNVSETAYQAGFSDPNYFSKVFKKYVGNTPSEYIIKLNFRK